jgi:hypothetical protein
MTIVSTVSLTPNITEAEAERLRPEKVYRISLLFPINCSLLWQLIVKDLLRQQTEEEEEEEDEEQGDRTNLRTPGRTIIVLTTEL